MSDTPAGGRDSGTEGFAPPDGGFVPPAGDIPPAPGYTPGYTSGYAPQMYPGYPASAVHPAYSGGYYGPPMLRKQTSGLAIAGMVLGIVSLLLFWASLLAPLLAILGIIFSVLGISQSSKAGWNGTGMAVTGLVCSLVSAALWVALAIIVASLFA